MHSADEKKSQPKVAHDNFVIDISEAVVRGQRVDLREKYPDIAESLRTCEFTHGDNFETIVKFDKNKPSKMIIKSIRTNDCGRVLVLGRKIEDKVAWLMINHLEWHEYKKAERTILENKQRILTYIDNHWDSVMEQFRALEAKRAADALSSSSSKPSYSYISSSSIPVPAESKKDPEAKAEEKKDEEKNEDNDDEEIIVEEMTIFNNQLIELNEEQKKAINARNQIICGMPGTGKSCVAMQIMSDVLGETREEGLDEKHIDANEQVNKKRIVYVTASEKLKKNMQDMHKQKGIEFKTYLELMQELIPSIKQKEIVGKEEFMKWADKYLEKIPGVMPQEPSSKGKKPGNFKAELQANISRVNKDANLLDFLNQECRIMSGLSREEYRAIGRNQSLFSTDHLDSQNKKNAFRDKLYDILDAYRVVLKEREQVDLAFLDVKEYITLAEHFYHLVIDEAQDFSTLQLATLYKLAKYINYFLDTQQSLHDNLSKIPYLEQLLHTKQRSELTQSLRCARGIVDMANVVLNMKYKLTGGMADKHLKARMTGKEDASEGHVSWIDQPTLAQEEQMLAAVTSPQCAIITLPEFIEDAKNKFPGAHILTIDQAKGLEFETVIAYRIFESGRYFHINDLLSKHEGVVKEDVNKPGSGEAHHEYGPDFSRLFTVITRAKKSLIIYNDWQDLKLIKTLNAEKEAKKYDVTFILKTSPVVTKVELNINQGEERYDYRIIKYGEAPREGFIDWGKLAEEGMVDIPLKSKDLLTIIPTLLPKLTSDPIDPNVKPTVYQPLWDIELVRSQHQEFSHKTRCIREELKSVIKVEQSAILSDALLVGTEQNWLEVIKKDIANVETESEITLENVCQIYASAWELYRQKIGDNVKEFYYLVKPPEILNLLQQKEFLKILSEPELLAQLTTEHLKSSLAEFCKSLDGVAILVDRLKNNPAIFEKIKASDFFIKDKDNMSAAYFLTTSSDRENLFLTLLDQTQIFKKDYGWQDLFVPAKGDRSFNRSIFFNLAEHDGGHVILEKLFAPLVLAQKTCRAEDLARALFTEVSMAGFPFYNLANSASGIKILSLLLKASPDLAKQITAKQLRIVVKHYTQTDSTQTATSSLDLLANSSEGLQLLAGITKSNRTLWAELNSKPNERKILEKMNNPSPTVPTETKEESVDATPPTPSVKKESFSLPDMIKSICNYKILDNDEQSYKNFEDKVTKLFAEDIDTCAAFFEIKVPTRDNKETILIDSLMNEKDKRFALIDILRKSDKAKKFTIEKLRSKIVTITDPPQTPFYYLCFHYPAFLGVLAEKNPELIQQITMVDLMSVNPLFPDATALNCLCSKRDGTGIKVLSFLLDQSKTLINNMDALYLTLRLSPNAPEFGNTSPAYWLSASKLGRELFLKLMTEKIAKGFKAGDLLEMPTGKPLSILSHLSETKNGHEILLKLFQFNPDLIKKFDGKYLVDYLFSFTPDKCPFDNLANHDTGIDILAKLISGNEDIQKHINEIKSDKINSVPNRKAAFKKIADIIAKTQKTPTAELKSEEKSTHQVNLIKPELQFIKSLCDFKMTDPMSRDVFKNKLLKLFATDADTVAGLFAINVISKDKGKTNLIKHILSDQDKWPLLQSILAEDENIKKITMESLRSKCITLSDIPTSPLFYLIKFEDVFAFELFNSNKELAKQITVDDLMQVNPVLENATILFYLCSEIGVGLKTLELITKNNVNLVAEMEAKHLLLSIPSEGFDNISPASLLSSSKKGREILLSLMTEKVAKGFTGLDLMPAGKVSSISSKLSEAPDGHAILLKLYKHNPDVIKKLEGKHIVDRLFNVLSDGKYEFLNFVKFPSGIDVLTTLISENEDVAKNITFAQLCAPSNNKILSPIFYLSLSRKGCDFLSNLLKKNELLLSQIADKQDFLFKHTFKAGIKDTTLAQQLSAIDPEGLNVITLIKSFKNQNTAALSVHIPNTVTVDTAEDKHNSPRAPAKISETPQAMYGNKGMHLVVDNSDKLTGQDQTFHDLSAPRENSNSPKSKGS